MMPFMLPCGRCFWVRNLSSSTSFLRTFIINECWIFLRSMCLCVFAYTDVRVPHACSVPMEARRVRQIHWNCSFRWLGAIRWVLGTHVLSKSSCCLSLQVFASWSLFRGRADPFLFFQAFCFLPFSMFMHTYIVPVCRHICLCIHDVHEHMHMPMKSMWRPTVTAWNPPPWLLCLVHCNGIWVKARAW